MKGTLIAVAATDLAESAPRPPRKEQAAMRDGLTSSVVSRTAWHRES